MAVMSTRGMAYTDRTLMRALDYLACLAKLGPKLQLSHGQQLSLSQPALTIQYERAGLIPEIDTGILSYLQRYFSERVHTIRFNGGEMQVSTATSVYSMQKM